MAAEALAENTSGWSRWARPGILSLAMAIIVVTLSQQLPPIIEGLIFHPTAVATVVGHKSQVSRVGYKRQPVEKDFAVVTWTDDRGREHRDLLLTYDKGYAKGKEVLVRYALSSDGSTQLIWERHPHPYIVFIVLLEAATTAIILALWIQALRAAFRAPPAPGPTPDSDPSP